MSALAQSTLLFTLLSPSVRQNKIVRFIFPMRKWALEVLKAVMEKRKITFVKLLSLQSFYLQESSLNFLQVQTLYIPDLPCVQE